MDFWKRRWDGNWYWNDTIDDFNDVWTISGFIIRRIIEQYFDVWTRLATWARPKTVCYERCKSSTNWFNWVVCWYWSCVCYTFSYSWKLFTQKEAINAPCLFKWNHYFPRRQYLISVHSFRPSSPSQWNSYLIDWSAPRVL